MYSVISSMSSADHGRIPVPVVASHAYVRAIEKWLAPVRMYRYFRIPLGFRVLYIDPGAAQACDVRPRGARVVRVDLGSGGVEAQARPNVAPPPDRVRPSPQARALEWRRQLEAGEVRNRADSARREGVSRARVTQVLAVLDGGPSGAGFAAP